MILSFTSAQKFWNTGYLSGSISTSPVFNRFFDLTNRLNASLDFFEKQHKQNHTLTLRQDIISSNLLFIDVLYSSAIVNLLSELIGPNYFFTNVKHYLSLGKVPQLKWHRDTYRRGKHIVGNAPQVIKVAIYSSDVCLDSACMQIIPKSHRLTLDSYMFDLLLPFFSYKHNIIGPAGSFVIFDTSLLHRRKSCVLSNTFRSATIYAFAQHPSQAIRYRHCPHTSALQDYYASLSL